MSGRIQAPARVVLVDKPAGWTSYDVVRRAKRDLKGKIGHAGTLDPFATGLLVLLTGQATRLSALVMDLPKEYLATAQFGAASSTGDPTGEIEPVAGPTVSGPAVLDALDRFRGVLRQRVPMTSAVRVGGERLYEKARRGEEVETPEREVTVYDAALVAFDEVAQRAELVFRTGKGAYVRRLVEDLGAKLGTAAYTLALRRRSSGPFSVDDALSPEDLSAELVAGRSRSVLTPNEALAYLPAHEVAGRDAVRAANGNELRNAPPGRFRVLAEAGLLAVYEGGAEAARPLVVFPDPQE